jgi:3-keto-L-gulonate-6-phosphate decarboxylase
MPLHRADLGIRQEWVPLFDQYGVDLVVCGTSITTSDRIRFAASNKTRP